MKRLAALMVAFVAVPALAVPIVYSPVLVTLPPAPVMEGGYGTVVKAGVPTDGYWLKYGLMGDGNYYPYHVPEAWRSPEVGEKFYLMPQSQGVSSDGRTTYTGHALKDGDWLILYADTLQGSSR